MDYSNFWLVDEAGNYAGLATWQQVAESLEASPEGWIMSGTLRCYVEGDEFAMRAALAARG